MPYSANDSDSGSSASDSNEDRGRGNELLQQYRTSHGKLQVVAYGNLERYVEACQDAELLRGWLRGAGGDTLLSEMLGKQIDHLRPDRCVCACSM
jgi:hypothetical protein